MVSRETLSGPQITPNCLPVTGLGQWKINLHCKKKSTYRDLINPLFLTFTHFKIQWSEFQTAKMMYNAANTILPGNIPKLFSTKRGAFFYLRGEHNLKHLCARTTLKACSLSMCGVEGAKQTVCKWSSVQAWGSSLGFSKIPGKRRVLTTHSSFMGILFSYLAVYLFSVRPIRCFCWAVYGDRIRPRQEVWWIWRRRKDSVSLCLDLLLLDTLVWFCFKPVQIKAPVHSSTISTRGQSWSALF